jgi:hypothetical protein
MSVFQADPLLAASVRLARLLLLSDRTWWKPFAIHRSAGFSAAAVTLTTASPSPAEGAGNSS